MKIFDRYLFKNLILATTFVAIVLTFIIFLTQSLKFLEIIMDSGSSGETFWLLTALVLPRFFEVILPLSLMSATIFLYNKMTLDSELTAMRGMGHSAIALARPAIILSILVAIILWSLTLWITPISLAKMQTIRDSLTAEFSNILFREGIFNEVGSGLTVYVREKNARGEMAGLMIHDSRDKTAPPSTVLARRGILVANENQSQVVVFDGSRQDYNPQTKVLQRLAFDRYTVDLPESTRAKARWSEPDERTLPELLNPDMNNPRDVKALHEFNVEIHRRIASPLLALSFPLIGLLALLIGPIDRRGQSKKIALAILTVILIQGLFLAAYNISRNSNIGIILMYVLTVAPLCGALFMLSGFGERYRRRTRTQRRTA